MGLLVTFLTQFAINSGQKCKKMRTLTNKYCGEIEILCIKKWATLKKTFKKPCFCLENSRAMQPSLRKGVLYLLDFRMKVKIETFD
jgi:hypothetical protein